MALRPLASLLLALACVAMTAAPARAQDDPVSIEDALGGFEDIEADDSESDSETEADWEESFDDVAAGTEGPDGVALAPTRFWQLTGGLDGSTAYAYNEHYVPNPDDPPDGRTHWGNLVKNRIDGDLQLDIDLPWDWDARAELNGFYDFAYVSKGRSQFSDSVIDVYEWEIDSGEVYLEGTVTSSLDLKIGRQIENWGRSESIRIVDRINPLDNREIGLVDIEDLRRPVGMVKADYYWDAWTVTGVVVLEQRYDRNPVPGSDYYPNIDIELPAGLMLPPSVLPSNLNFDADRGSDWTSPPEYALRVGGVFSGWDVSFYAGRFTENRLVIDYATFQFLGFTLPDPATLGLETNRINMVGTVDRSFKPRFRLEDR